MRTSRKTIFRFAEFEAALWRVRNDAPDDPISAFNKGRAEKEQADAKRAEQERQRRDAREQSRQKIKELFLNLKQYKNILKNQRIRVILSSKSKEGNKVREWPDGTGINVFLVKTGVTRNGYTPRDVVSIHHTGGVDGCFFIFYISHWGEPDDIKAYRDDIGNDVNAAASEILRRVGADVGLFGTWPSALLIIEDQAFGYSSGSMRVLLAWIVILGIALLAARRIFF